MELGMKIEKIINGKLVDPDMEMEEFEQLLSEIIKSNNSEYIRALYLAFDDRFELPEYGENLLYTVEHSRIIFGDEKGFEILIEMLPNAQQWAEWIHARILNEEIGRKIYAALVSNADPNLQKLVINIMNQLKEESPSHYDSTAEVLSIIEARTGELL
ncbi:Imm30 family immunity protein [Lysinibacillus sp. NPDC056185]|uniref:Imm30 family immunity protein n=1 Tax=Lysinibacillus sp. NPDC056185 TaxID=3345739 RepID=UPI0039EF902B